MKSLKPITSPPGAKRSSRGPAIVVFAMMALIGVGLIGGIFLPWGWTAMRAASWPETPCEILSSSVERSPGRRTHYRVDVKFVYVVNGQSYRSDRYALHKTGSSRPEAKREIVQRLPSGTRTVCYVDPSDPTYAVLNRSLSGDFLIIIVPAVFAIIGLVGLAQLIRISPSRSVAAVKPMVMKNVRLGSGPTRGVGPLLGMIALALFWNGIVVMVPWGRLRDSGPNSSFTWPMVLFLIPFVTVGVVMIGLVVRLFVGLFEARTKLEVPRTAIPLGGLVDIGWKSEPRMDPKRGFRIALEGVEVAASRGKSDRGSEHVFVSVPVADSENGDDIRHGLKKVRVPKEAMHSVDHEGSGIVWAVRLYRRFRRSAKVVEQEVLEVRPVPVARGAFR